MIHAFAVTVGVILGVVFALGCMAGLLWAAVALCDRWLIRQVRPTTGSEAWIDPWNEPWVDLALTRSKPTEIESWWVPMDEWDYRR